MFVEKILLSFLFVFDLKIIFCSVLLEGKVDRTVHSPGTSGRQVSCPLNKCTVIAAHLHLFLICF